MKLKIENAKLCRKRDDLKTNEILKVHAFRPLCNCGKYHKTLNTVWIRKCDIERLIDEI